MKPDGVQRRLVGEIVQRFERKGFKLVALKLVQVGRGAGRRRWGGGGEAAAPQSTDPVPSAARLRRSCCESTMWSFESAPSSAAWSSTWARGPWWPW